MEKELDYFRIEGAAGGCQDWFTDPFMKMGGCAAAAACDSSICFDLYHGTKGLYPFDLKALSRDDYVRFSGIMKPYLRPRLTGIDRLEIYIKGYGRYLADQGCHTVGMEAFLGDEPVSEARRRIVSQIGRGYPIPCLTLRHKDPAFKDYDWHWFMLTGYRTERERFFVKAVTYGKAAWLDLDALWNTGYERKGGLILYRSFVSAPASRRLPPT